MKKMKTHRANKKADDIPRSATFQPGKHTIPMHTTFSRTSKKRG